mgnify:FL=1
MSQFTQQIINFEDGRFKKDRDNTISIKSTFIKKIAKVTRKVRSLCSNLLFCFKGTSLYKKTIFLKLFRIYIHILNSLHLVQHFELDLYICSIFKLIMNEIADTFCNFRFKYNRVHF